MFALIQTVTLINCLNVYVIQFDHIVHRAMLLESVALNLLGMIKPFYVVTLSSIIIIKHYDG